MKRLEELARVTKPTCADVFQGREGADAGQLKLMDPEEKLAKKFEEKLRLKEKAIE